MFAVFSQHGFNFHCVANCIYIGWFKQLYNLFKCKYDLKISKTALKIFQ